MNMSILEDLWFDNLVVQDVDIRKGSEQEKALAASEKCEDVLRKTLTEKQQEQFVLCGERRNELLSNQTRKRPRHKGRTENTDDHDQGTIRISLYMNSPNLWLTSKVTL